MNTTVILDKTGRVVLPSAVRRRLNLQPGARLRLELLAERIELTVQSDEAQALQVSPAGRQVLPPTGAVFDAATAVREERAAQAQRRRSR
jgi:AbrB family looped-hinge helix DNA binding protein